MGPLNLGRGYRRARSLVAGAGFAEDIAWAEGLANVRPDAHYILRESAWVIVNSGFRFQVAVKLWPRLREVFHDFQLERVSLACVPPALEILDHPGKMEAIAEMACILRVEGIDRILEEAKDPPRLQRLPWIGRITCYHLGKLLGADVVKPDVHLQRAAAAAGQPSALALCDAIRVELGADADRRTVIDSVLWRYGEQQRARAWPEWAELWDTAPKPTSALG